MGRADYSRERIEQLRERLEPIEAILGEEPLCIYATGSYGRLEAWPGSDIDLFFLADGHPKDHRIASLRFIRLAACLIEAAEEMGFPAFSRDGQYLEVQYADQMEEVLGSPEDDGLNAFTARMLLLLESRQIYGSELYEQLLGKVIGFYFRDLAGHEDDFQPIFLNNDILRFWRTLTLNYENKRYQITRLPEAQRAAARAESALKNYKLKLSRLATCFSMILHLASERPPVLAERVFELCQLTPGERFEALRGKGATADQKLERLGEMYGAFLDRVQIPSEELLELFHNPEERKALLGDAREFGEEIFELLFELTPREQLRHLVV